MKVKHLINLARPEFCWLDLLQIVGLGPKFWFGPKLCLHPQKFEFRVHAYGVAFEMLPQISHKINLRRWIKFDLR